MSSPRRITGKSPPRPVSTIWLVIGLMLGLTLGLAACRGFFGQAPIALLTYALPGDGDQEAPVTVTFDISGSTDPDGTIASYELGYGDGSTKTGTAIPTATFTHEYTEGGTFTVTLTVTDNDGRIGKDTKIIVIGAAMITFTSNRNSSYYGIYRMQVDDPGSETEVRNTANEELFPDLVRGTRDKIAYAAEGSDWNIFTMGVDGGALAQLTQTPSNEIQPSWSYLGNQDRLRLQRNNADPLYHNVGDLDDDRRWRKPDSADYADPILGPGLFAGERQDRLCLRKE